MLYIDYNLSVNSGLLNSSRVLIFGLSLQICKASSVSSLWVLAVWSIIYDFSSAIPPTSLLHSNKCCPTGESLLRCSSTLVTKCWTVWLTKVELHPLHVSLYTTLDISSRAKGILRDGKHVFNFLVVKLISAPDISRTFAANSWDGLPRYCIVRRGGESFNHLSFLGSDAYASKFFLPSMILLRVSNTTLSDQFLDIDFQSIASVFF